MRKFLLPILVFSCALWGHAQVTFQGCSAEFSTATYTLNLNPALETNDGGTIRNTYESFPAFGDQACNGFGFGLCEFRVIWDVTNDEWLLQLTGDGVGFFTMWSNKSASEPDPPSLTLGTWVEDAGNTGGTCGSITTLSGDVQNSVTVPIELIGFSSSLKGKRVNLQWETATELNNAHFEVQRSMDGVAFETIGKVQGAGSSTQKHHYTFIDHNPENGTNYYRLVQFDFDGTSSASKVIAQTLKYEQTTRLFPNPATDVVTLQWKETFPTDSNLRIIDAYGRVVYSQKIAANSQELLLDVDTWEDGVYYIEFINQQQSLTYYFMKR